MRQAINKQKKKTKPTWACLSFEKVLKLRVIARDTFCGYRIAALPDPSKIVRGVRLPLPAFFILEKVQKIGGYIA